MSETVLEARNIVKRYGHVTAVNGADFDLRAGEVLAVIGDNGAGKSSLIKVLSGDVIPDSGEVLLDGQQVHFRSPHDAQLAGIETVYQDLAVAPQLDAVANIFLGRERRMTGLLGRLGFLDQQRMQRETGEQLEELHVRIPDPTKPLSTFSGGQRQGVAVARAVMWASKVVIMDEPTAALGVAQVGMVLDLVRQVRQTGIPVVFISHNMPQVFDVADRIVVLQLGEVVAELDPEKASTDDAVAAMTGSLRGEERG